MYLRANLVRAQQSHFLRIRGLTRTIYGKIGTSSTYYTPKSYDEMPSPFGLPKIGSLLSLLLSGGPKYLHKHIDKRHKQLGPIFKEQLGPISSVFISDPLGMRDVIAREGSHPKHILPAAWVLYNKIYNYERGIFFMDGEEWLTLRKKLNTVLLKKSFTNEAASCEEYLRNQYSIWSKTPYVDNLEDKLYNVSIVFIVSLLLGSPFESKINEFQADMQEMATVVKNVFVWSVKLSVVPAELAVLLKLKMWTEFVVAIQDSVNVASRLLNRMLIYRGDGILNDLIAADIPLELISRVIVDFILAAGDTTANATQWIFYCLGRNMDAQNKLYDDIISRGVDSPYLANVVREAARLFPVAPFLTRYLPNDEEICGYIIPADTCISFSFFTSGRNDEYFPEADKFLPERWYRNDDRKYRGVNNVWASQPFATGLRSCIGKKMAQAQLNCTIAELIKHYRLIGLNEVEAVSKMVIVPSKPLELKLVPRC